MPKLKTGAPPAPAIVASPRIEALIARATEMDRVSSSIDKYEACLPILQQKMPELLRKFGDEKTASFLTDALDLDARNWYLRNMAIAKAEGWMSSSLYSREKLVHAMKGFNLALDKISDMGIRVVLQSKFFQNEKDDGGLLKIADWQLWKLVDYAKQCEGDGMTFYSFMEIVFLNMGEKPVDFTELIAMARAVPENATMIFNGETPEAKEWFARAKKVQAQLAEEIRAFLQGLGGALALNGVQLRIEGEGFATDWETVRVPPVIGRYPTKEENHADYTLGMYHECEGHIAGRSFEINVFAAQLDKLGYRLRNPATIKPDDDYVEVETLDGKPLLDDEGDVRRFRINTAGFVGPNMKAHEFRTSEDLLALFGDDVGLAHHINNIIEDRRIDDVVKRKNRGISQEYERNKQKHLHFREHASDDNNAGHVFEAFLQLVIVPLDPADLNERVAEVQKKIDDVAELKAKGLAYDKDELAYLERQKGELTSLLQRHAALMKMPKALELVKLAEAGFTGNDGTASFNASIDVVKRFKEMFKNYKQFVVTFDSHLIPEDVSGLRKARLEKKKPKKGKKPGEEEEEDGGKPGGKPDDDEKAKKRKEQEPEEGEGEFHYPEWDETRQRFVYKHTRVVEEPAPVGDVEPHPIMSAVTETFLRLKPQDKIVVRGVEEGDEIDPDLWVEYLAARKAGQNPEPRFWTKMKRNKRSVATALLVDCSGSTSGQVLATELQAMHVLANALETVGDPFAIWGYNSNGREMTYFYILKEWGERLANQTLKSNHANRDGAAIRHATTKLLERAEKTKILIILADGFPADDGGYSGEYAMADTRHAVEEAIAKGVVVFCIAVRNPGSRMSEWYLGSELTKIYGEGRVKEISDLGMLPSFLPLFWRRVTGL